MSACLLEDRAITDPDSQAHRNSDFYAVVVYDV